MCFIVNLIMCNNAKVFTVGPQVHFLVFRKAIIKVLAEEANINTNDVIFILLDCDDPE